MIRRLRLRVVAALSSFVFLALLAAPVVALAQEEAPAQVVISDPTGGLLAAVPGGIYVYGLFVMIASLVSVFVADSKMPGFLRTVVNFLAMNGGKAKNDPSVN